MPFGVSVQQLISLSGVNVHRQLPNIEILINFKWEMLFINYRFQETKFLIVYLGD